MNDAITTPDTSNKLLFLAQNLHGHSEEKIPAHVNADVMRSTGTICKLTLSCSTWWFFPNRTDCTKEIKFKRQKTWHTLGPEGKAADWNCDLTCQWKNARLVTTSRNPFWNENTSEFISEGIHLKDCTHFVLLTQRLIINMQKKNWFCHQVSNFVGLLFPLKQMIAANRAKPA